MRRKTAHAVTAGHRSRNAHARKTGTATGAHQHLAADKAVAGLLSEGAGKASAPGVANASPPAPARQGQRVDLRV